MEEKDIFKQLIEKKLDKTEMPEEHKCKCREGLKYDRESTKCKRCVGAEQMKHNVIMAALLSGRTDILAICMGLGKEEE